MNAGHCLLLFITFFVHHCKVLYMPYTDTVSIVFQAVSEILQSCLFKSIVLLFSAILQTDNKLTISFGTYKTLSTHTLFHPIQHFYRMFSLLKHPGHCHELQVSFSLLMPIHSTLFCMCVEENKSRYCFLEPLMTSEE